MTLLCITESMPGRPCTVRDHHLTTCDGKTRKGQDCKGCLPRPADKGILCRNCFDRFEAALNIAVDLVTHLRSVEKGPVSVDGIRTATVVTPTFPGSWQAADRLWVALAHIAIEDAEARKAEEPLWPVFTSIWEGFSAFASLDQVAEAARGLTGWLGTNPEALVARTSPAEAAVEFYREVQRTLAMFPLEEKAQKLRPIRCRECDQFTLWKHPPLTYLEDVVVQCANPACMAFYDPAMASFDMKVLAEQISKERSDLSADIELQVAKLLAPKPLDQVHAVCDRCASVARYRGREVFEKRKTVDETCHVCRAITGSGLYMKAGAA